MVQRKLSSLVSDLSKRAHAGIEASIALFQRDFDPKLTFRWVPTGEVAASTPAQSLGSATGIWCVPGSPYGSTDGALQAIRFAREHQRVFFGTLWRFQHALMEFCQNVVGRNAAHQEMDGEATDPLIVKLTCSLEGAKGRILAADGSWFAEVRAGIESVEEFNCNTDWLRLWNPSSPDLIWSLLPATKLGRYERSVWQRIDSLWALYFNQNAGR